MHPLFSDHILSNATDNCNNVKDKYLISQITLKIPKYIWDQLTLTLLPHSSLLMNNDQSLVSFTLHLSSQHHQQQPCMLTHSNKTGLIRLSIYSYPIILPTPLFESDMTYVGLRLCLICCVYAWNEITGSGQTPEICSFSMVFSMDWFIYAAWMAQLLTCNYGKMQFETLENISSTQHSETYSVFQLMNICTVP